MKEHKRNSSNAPDISPQPPRLWYTAVRTRPRGWHGRMLMRKVWGRWARSWQSGGAFGKPSRRLVHSRVWAGRAGGGSQRQNHSSRGRMWNEIPRRRMNLHFDGVKARRRRVRRASAHWVETLRPAVPLCRDSRAKSSGGAGAVFPGSVASSSARPLGFVAQFYSCLRFVCASSCCERSARGFASGGSGISKSRVHERDCLPSAATRPHCSSNSR